MSATLQVLRITARSLARRHRAWAIGVIACYALGLTVAIAGSAVSRVLLFAPPPHIRAPAELVVVFPRWTISTGAKSLDEGLTSVVDLQALAREPNGFVSLAGVASRELSLGDPGAGESGEVAFVTPSFFRVLGTDLALGRAPDSLATDEVVVSHAYWRRALGADSRVLGRRMLIDGRPYRVSGVAPGSFTGITRRPVAAWLPTEAARNALFDGDDVPWRMMPWLTTVARLPPDTRPAAVASRATNLLQGTFHSAVQGRTGGTTVRAELQPVEERWAQEIGRSGRVTLFVLALCLAVLGVACSNALHLLLGRAIATRGEIDVRRALGAPTRILLFGVAVESGALVALGAAVACPLAWVVARAMLRQLLPPGLQSAFTLDGATIATGAALAVGSWLLGAVVPLGILLGRSAFAGVRGGFATEGRGAAALRRGVLATQIATSCALLGLSGAALDGLRDVARLPLGFTPDRVLVAQVSVNGGDLRQTLPPLVELLRAQPGVTAAVAEQAPFLPGRWWPVVVPAGASVAANETARSTMGSPVAVNAVTPDYFAAIGQRVVRGRPLRGDDRGEAVLINEAFAKRMSGGGAALGRCIVVDIPAAPAGAVRADSSGARPSSRQCRSVVGVVADARLASLRGAAEPQVIVPVTHGFRLERALVLVRSDGAIQEPELRRLVLSRVPGVASVRVRPYADVMAPLTAPWRAAAWLFGALGAVALGLTVLGLYGTVSYGVALRRREFAIRRALGATGSVVTREVVGRHLPVVIGGFLVGGLASVVTNRVVRSLFEAPPSGVVSRAAALVIIVASVAAASFAAARHASRDDLAGVLRED